MFKKKGKNIYDTNCSEISVIKLEQIKTCFQDENKN